MKFRYSGQIIEKEMRECTRCRTLPHLQFYQRGVRPETFIIPLDQELIITCLNKCKTLSVSDRGVHSLIELLNAWNKANTIIPEQIL